LEGLTRFLHDGRIELDANSIGRATRPVALGPTPPASDKSGFATDRYQFRICDIVSTLRMPTHGMRMFTGASFCGGSHGQESAEVKEDRESSQESSKEDLRKRNSGIRD
jgi:hypothetical protein